MANTEYFAGVQLSPSRITASVFDRVLRLAGKSKRSTKAERGPQVVVDRIGRAVLDALDEADLSLSDLSGVGVALSAQFDPTYASAQRPGATQWKELQSSWQRVLKAPVLSMPIGLACAAGLRAAGEQCKVSRLAVLFVEEELAGGLVRNGQLDEEFDRKIVGDDRWLDWGGDLSALPGKKRYRKMSNLLAKNDPMAMDLFGRISEQLTQVVTRCLDKASPDRIALVGLGAEELKNELMQALTSSAGLSKRLSATNCVVPALGTNACQVGAAALATEL